MTLGQFTDDPILDVNLSAHVLVPRSVCMSSFLHVTTFNLSACDQGHYGGKITIDRYDA